MESAGAYLLFTILRRPIRLKGEGVYEVHDRAGVDFVEHVLNHAVRVL